MFYVLTHQVLFRMDTLIRVDSDDHPMTRSISREANPVIDKWLSIAEGAVTPQAVSGEDVHCDFCRNIIEPGEKLTSYLSDNLVNPREPHKPDFPPFHALRAYCSECDRYELLDPCQGYTEVLLESELNSDRCLYNFELVDCSPAGSGIPYDPVELWNVGHEGIGFQEFQETLERLQGYEVRLGPADISDDYRLHGIETTDLYDKNGTITVSDEQRKKIQEKFNPRE